MSLECLVVLLFNITKLLLGFKRLLPVSGSLRWRLAIDILSSFNSSELGKAALIWKDFANPAHTEARGAAIAARCADKQGKFWEYHDYLFENQDNLSRDLYNKISLELKLDLATFNKCVDGQETVELVGQGMADGQQIGVDATPYIIIGKRVFNYALSEEELRQAVEKELENQENKKAKNQ